jgi:lactoylglutathione lyase
MIQLLPYFLFGCQLLHSITAHSILNIQEDQYPYPVLGTDEASSISTTGYFVNHFAISTNNLTASVEFYSDVLGFRRLFTLQFSKTYSITYLGHAQGGKNGTGYQTALEMNREKNNAQGLIEIYYVDIPVKNIESASQRANTFGHVGIVVPDTKVLQERLDTMPHINIIKKFGEPFVDLNTDSVVGPAIGLSGSVVAQLSLEEREAIVRGFGNSVDPLIFLTDPDGNFIEIQPQEGAGLVQ